MKVTKYQKKLDAKEITPCTGLDWLMIAWNVENVLKEPENLTKKEAGWMLEVKMEIDHYYQEEPEKLTKFWNIVKEKRKRKQKNESTNLSEN